MKGRGERDGEGVGEERGRGWRREGEGEEDIGRKEVKKITM